MKQLICRILMVSILSLLGYMNGFSADGTKIKAWFYSESDEDYGKEHFSGFCEFSSKGEVIFRGVLDSTIKSLSLIESQDSLSYKNKKNSSFFVETPIQIVLSDFTVVRAEHGWSSDNSHYHYIIDYEVRTSRSAQKCKGTLSIGRLLGVYDEIYFEFKMFGKTYVIDSGSLVYSDGSVSLGWVEGDVKVNVLSIPWFRQIIQKAEAKSKAKPKRQSKSKQNPVKQTKQPLKK